LAIDRIDDAVSYLFEPLHPAVLRLIRYVLQAAAATRTQVSMCGEMAGDPRYVPVLLGLGLRELSMQPGSLLEVKDVVRGCHIGALEAAMDDMMERLDDLTPAELLDALKEANHA
jgi:phosphotransferase system enzyme I (PtsI)